MRHLKPQIPPCDLHEEVEVLLENLARPHQLLLLGNRVGPGSEGEQPISDAVFFTSEKSMDSRVSA